MIHYNSTTELIKPNPVQCHVQSDRFVPHRVQRRLNRFGLLFDAVRVGDQLQFHVRIAEAIWIHRDEIATLFDCTPKGSIIKYSIMWF